MRNNLKSILFTVATLIVIVKISDILYQQKKVFKRGYVVQINTQKNLAIKTKSKKSIAKKSDEHLQDKINIKEMIKNANATQGKKVFKKCSACHDIRKNGKNKLGPNLFNIVNKKKASVDNFKYSDALKNKGGIWSYEELNLFLQGPRSYIKGTKMTFAGLKKDKDRANIIRYLESQSQK